MTIFLEILKTMQTYRFDLLQYWHNKICEDFEKDTIEVELFLVLDAALMQFKESDYRELFYINLN